MPSSTSSDTRAGSGQANYDDAEKGGVVAGSKKEGGAQAILPGAKDLRSKDTTTLKKRWWLPKPREPFESFDTAPVMPVDSASFISKMLFLWIQPMLTTGYQVRPVPSPSSSHT